MLGSGTLGVEFSVLPCCAAGLTVEADGVEPDGLRESAMRRASSWTADT